MIQLKCILSYIAGLTSGLLIFLFITWAVEYNSYRSEPLPVKGSWMPKKDSLRERNEMLLHEFSGASSR